MTAPPPATPQRYLGPTRRSGSTRAWRRSVRSSAMVVMLGSHSVAVRADDIAFRDLRAHVIEGDRVCPLNGFGHLESLRAAHVVEIHRACSKAATAVGAGAIFRLFDDLPNSRPILRARATGQCAPALPLGRSRGLPSGLESPAQVAYPSMPFTRSSCPVLAHVSVAETPAALAEPRVRPGSFPGSIRP